MYSKEEMSIANQTERKGGAIGSNSIVLRRVLEIAQPADKILDFGSGSKIRQALVLREKGFKVVCHEFGGNVNDNHDKDALSRRYDIVYASSVINVQNSLEMLRKTLQQIRPVVRKEGVFVFNFPKVPRKGQFTDGEMLQVVHEYFPVINKVSPYLFEARINVKNKK